AGGGWSRGVAGGRCTRGLKKGSKTPGGAPPGRREKTPTPAEAAGGRFWAPPRNAAGRIVERETGRTVTETKRASREPVASVPADIGLASFAGRRLKN